MTVSMPQPETPEANTRLAQFYQQLLARPGTTVGIEGQALEGVFPVDTGGRLDDVIVGQGWLGGPGSFQNQYN